MITKEDLIYRQVVTLRDGARVLMRPLVPDDRQALLDLFLPTPMEERSFMRLRERSRVVAGWADNIRYDKVFPLIAVVGERIVGVATLHFNEGAARHRAEMRAFLAGDFAGGAWGRR
jgi:hypothetical protein